MTKIKVLVGCVHCESQHEFEVVKEAYDSWKLGEVLIQDAMPELTPSQRELLMSQTCDDCWQQFFSDEEDVIDEEDFYE
jgi:hypothetical protein